MDLFKGLFDNEFTVLISPEKFLLCVGAALVIGVLMGLSYMVKTRYTKSFVVTLMLLPAVVAVVIMMVNGNIGAGVAVAGAFSLVRFRSVPGTAKEIVAIFLAMGAGLIVGMGYLAYGVLFTLVLCAAFIVCNFLDLGEKKNSVKYRTLRITVPEDLDYTGVFEEVLGEVVTEAELVQVKTVNLGSMFRLTYDVTMKKGASEKALIDAARARNGNLEVFLSRRETTSVGL